jgi:hypothetical protein
MDAHDIVQDRLAPRCDGHSQSSFATYLDRRTFSNRGTF